MANKTFEYDLDYGQKAENWFDELLHGRFGALGKLEVKSDRKSKDTGNIFVELYSRGKESGLKTSHANYWGFYLEGMDTAIIVGSERLKKLVNHTVKKNNMKLKEGGDDNTSRGVLIRLSEIFVNTDAPVNDDIPNNFFL
jgi:hypothetical protein